MYNYNNNHLPISFENMFRPCNPPNRTNSYKVIKSRITYLHQFPTAFLPKTWNELHRSLKASASLSIFKRNLKDTLMQSFNWRLSVNCFNLCYTYYNCKIIVLRVTWVRGICLQSVEAIPFPPYRGGVGVSVIKIINYQGGLCLSTPLFLVAQCLLFSIVVFIFLCFCMII